MLLRICFCIVITTLPMSIFSPFSPKSSLKRVRAAAVASPSSLSLLPRPLFCFLSLSFLPPLAWSCSSAVAVRGRILSPPLPSPPLGILWTKLE